MRDHPYELLECSLQNQWTTVWDILQDKQSKDFSHVVPPAWKVCDYVLEGDESGSNQLMVHVDGQAGQEVNKVISGHVSRHDSWDSSNTGFQQVQLRLHRAMVVGGGRWERKMGEKREDEDDKG
jgi:hypothetical protein